MRATRALLVPPMLVILFWVVWATAQTTSRPDCVAARPTGGAPSLNSQCNCCPGETTHCQETFFNRRYGNVHYKEVCQWACARGHKECCAPTGSCYVCGTENYKGKCDSGRTGYVVYCIPNTSLPAA